MHCHFVHMWIKIVTYHVSIWQLVCFNLFQMPAFILHLASRENEYIPISMNRESPFCPEFNIFLETTWSYCSIFFQRTHLALVCLPIFPSLFRAPTTLPGHSRLLSPSLNTPHSSHLSLRSIAPQLYTPHPLFPLTHLILFPPILNILYCREFSHT